MTIQTKGQPGGGLSVHTIKLLAAALMLLDHIHQMFYMHGAPLWLSMAGRAVFPLFLFASAEGFAHTRSKRAYLRRLLLGSIAMVAMTTALQQLVPNENVVLMNNAFSTFFVAGWYMLCWDIFTDGLHRRRPWLVVLSLLMGLVPVLTSLPMLAVGWLSSVEGVSFPLLRVLVALALMIPNLLSAEGGPLMVLLGVLFYIFRKRRTLQIISLLLLSALTYIIGGGYQWMMCLAAPVMALYNGQRGQGSRQFFYIYYPAHIALLYLLSSWA